jgi:hypothetical protein
MSHCSWLGFYLLMFHHLAIAPSWRPNL